MQDTRWVRLVGTAADLARRSTCAGSRPGSAGSGSASTLRRCPPAIRRLDVWRELASVPGTCLGGVRARPGAAGAVCDAYQALGELSEPARESVEIMPRPDGWLRVNLPAGTADETAHLMSALGELLQEAAAPLSRLTPSVRASDADMSDAHGLVPGAGRPRTTPRPSRRLPPRLDALGRTRRARVPPQRARSYPRDRDHHMGDVRSTHLVLDAAMSLRWKSSWASGGLRRRDRGSL
jgi:hypothetical protein